jgi:hypothetical protein
MNAKVTAFERPGSGTAAAAASEPATRTDGPEATPASRAAADYLHLHHVPAPVAARFGEALGCYSHGLWQATAVMCRLTVEAILADVGTAGRLRIYDLVSEVQEAAGLDDASFGIVRAILFEGAAVPQDLDRWHAAVLVETLKDLLSQQYVRPARLRQAFAVRRFFATESVAPPPAGSPEAPRRPGD